MPFGCIGNFKSDKGPVGNIWSQIGIQPGDIDGRLVLDEILNVLQKCFFPHNGAGGGFGVVHDRDGNNGVSPVEIVVPVERTNSHVGVNRATV